MMGEARGHSNELELALAFRPSEAQKSLHAALRRLHLLWCAFYIFLCKLTCNRHRLATLPVTRYLVTGKVAKVDLLPQFAIFFSYTCVEDGPKFRAHFARKAASAQISENIARNSRSGQVLAVTVGQN